MFYLISGAAFLWDLLGVSVYVQTVTISPDALAALPDAQRALYENMPTWATSAFAIATSGGALGTLLLLLRKAIALPVLIVSLVADEGGRRLLVVTYSGELLLFDISGTVPELKSRRKPMGHSLEEEIYSHPAIVGDRLYVRGTQSLNCVVF